MPCPSLEEEKPRTAVSSEGEQAGARGRLGRNKAQETAGPLSVEVGSPAPTLVSKPGGQHGQSTACPVFRKSDAVL